jgi:hypothetical protein
VVAEIVKHGGAAGTAGVVILLDEGDEAGEGVLVEAGGAVEELARGSIEFGRR